MIWRYVAAKFFDYLTVEVHTNQCLRNCVHDNDCSYCVDSCPAHAISVVDEIVEIDSAKCELCDACLYSCPKGVFSRVDTVYEKIMNLKASSQPLGVSCSRQDFAVDLKLPCLEFFDAVMVMGIFLNRKEIYIHCNPADCEKCPFSFELTPAVKQFTQIAELFRGAGIIAVDKVRAGKDKKLNRRDFFTDMSSKTIDNSTTAYNLLKPGQNTGKINPYVAKKRFLNWIVKKLKTLEQAAINSQTCFFPGITDRIIAEQCNLCGKCSSLCPTNALVLDTDTVSVELLFDNTVCVDCEICLSVCEHITPDAIKIDTLTHENLPRVINHQPAETCSDCGDYYPASEKECPACRRRIESREKIFQSLDMQ